MLLLPRLLRNIVFKYFKVFITTSHKKAEQLTLRLRGTFDSGVVAVDASVVVTSFCF